MFDLFVSLGDKDVKLNLKPLDIKPRMESVNYYRGYKEFMIGMWALEDETVGNKRSSRVLENDLGDWLRAQYKLIHGKSNKEGKVVNALFNKALERYVNKSLMDLQLPENKELANRAIDKGFLLDCSDVDFDFS